MHSGNVNSYIPLVNDEINYLNIILTCISAYLLTSIYLPTIFTFDCMNSHLQNQYLTNYIIYLYEPSNLHFSFCAFCFYHFYLNSNKFEMKIVQSLTHVKRAIEGIFAHSLQSTPESSSFLVAVAVTQSDSVRKIRETIVYY